MYKPRILIDVNLEQSLQREKEEQRMRDREEARQQVNASLIIIYLIFFYLEKIHKFLLIGT